MYIAFDIGGTYVKHCVIKDSGRIVEKGKYITNCTERSVFMRSLKDVIDRYSSRYEVQGIAVAMPGIIHVDSGYMKEAGAVEALWGENLKKLMGEITSLPVEVENDANCVALAEKFNGNAVECNDFVCMTIGTGIGGGVFLGNRIHHGFRYTGGEFGHMRINMDNPSEPLHDNCSTRGLINMYKKYKGIPEDTPISGQLVFDEAAIDEGTAEVVDRWHENIAVAVYNLTVTLCPQKFLIGGGVSEREDFVERIEKILRRNPNWENLGAELGVCRHKNDAGMLGALYHFLSRSNIRTLKFKEYFKEG